MVDHSTITIAPFPTTRRPRPLSSSPQPIICIVGEQTQNCRPISRAFDAVAAAAPTRRQNQPRDAVPRAMSRAAKTATNQHKMRTQRNAASECASPKLEMPVCAFGCAGDTVLGFCCVTFLSTAPTAPTDRTGEIVGPGHDVVDVGVDVAVAVLIRGKLRPAFRGEKLRLLLWRCNLQIIKKYLQTLHLRLCTRCWCKRSCSFFCGR